MLCDPDIGCYYLYWMLFRSFVLVGSLVTIYAGVRAEKWIHMSFHKNGTVEAGEVWGHHRFFVEMVFAVVRLWVVGLVTARFGAKSQGKTFLEGKPPLKKKNCTEWLSVNSFGGQFMVRKWEIHGDSITTFTRAPNQLLIGSGLIMVVTQI